MWQLMLAPWHFEPMVLGPIVAVGLLYWSGAAQLRLPRRLVAAFYGGLAIVIIALLSPVDDVAEALFSGHMAQHLLLILIAAPLLALSRAAIVLFVALPLQIRIALSRAAKLLPRSRRPVAFWLAFNAIFLFWHMPQAYGWARANEGVHILEHGSLLLSAYGLWSVMVAPRLRAPSFAARALFLVVTAFVTDLPAVLMIFSPYVLYAVDPASVAQWGLTPLEDQQLAGLMMWVPASLVFFGAAIWLFAKYLAPPPPRSALASL